MNTLHINPYGTEGSALKEMSEALERCQAIGARIEVVSSYVVRGADGGEIKAETGKQLLEAVELLEQVKKEGEEK